MQERPLRDTRSILDRQTRDEPVVGIVATGEHTGHAVSEILRAHEKGHGTLVTAPYERCQTLEFARTLGSIVVEPPENAAETDDPRTRLTEAAREAGYPGLLYHEEPDQRIDYTASKAVLADSPSYTVDARIEPVVEVEQTVLVGIPAYDEAATIGPVVTAALEHADEVLVVDDGSDDDTAELARAAGATVVRHETNMGYGAALKTIFEQARACRTDHLVVLDGDGQHDVNDVSKLVETQQETDAHVVIGCRFGSDTNTKMPLYRRFGLGVINVFTNISMDTIRSGPRIRDTQSGFRAYDERAIQSLAADDAIGNRMNASIDILYHASKNDYDIVEVPTTIDYEIANGSSVGPVQHGIGLVMNIVRAVERDRPITLIGIPGVVFVLTGIVLAYWTAANYLQSGTFPIGLALTASIITLIGVFTAFTAIILHSLAVYND